MGGEGCINWPGLRTALITRKLGSGCHGTSNWEQGRVMLKQYLGWQWGDFPGGPVAKLHAPNAGGLGLIPGQGTRSHMLQLKILSAVTRPSRAKYINIFKREKKKNLLRRFELDYI